MNNWKVYYNIMEYVSFRNVISYFWRIFRTLGDLKLAIILLLLIALISSLGTVIEQEKGVAFYETNYPITKPILGIISSDVILFLGLDHIYSTNWFIFLLVLFGTSLSSCTFSRQIPSLKLAKLWQFFKKEQPNNKFGLAFRLSNTNLNELLYLLREESYNVIQQGPYIYAYKGLVGKVGPILVHASIIFILIGSILGSVGGFMVQEVVPKKELFHLQHVINSGPLSYIRQDFVGYIRDFKISYSEEGLIDQFYSDIELLDENLNKIIKKTIFVNEPLRYGGVTFYQTDWGVQSVKMIVDNLNELQVYLREIKLENGSRFWVGVLPVEEKTLLVIQDLNGKCLLYNSDKKIVGEGEIGHKFYLNGRNIRLKEIIPSTGLQAKSDPGIPMVYIGFLCLIFSVILSYTSYFQLWATNIKGNIYIYASTNRAVYSYEKNLLKTLYALRIDSSFYKNPEEVKRALYIKK